MKEKTIAFGPEKDTPSWNWVGFDAYRELSKYFNVSTFQSLSKVPKANIICVIKQIPSKSFLSQAHQQGSKVIYFPIDFFNSKIHIHQCGEVLRACDGLITHCEKLNTILHRFNPDLFYIDHNNKYALPKMASYKEKGYVLWIGGCQYVAYLLNWIKHHPIKNEIKILTDIENGRAVASANSLLRQMRISHRLDEDTTFIDDIEVCKWSERLQHEMLEECKAAIDIKGSGDFNQSHKPATKSQKYVASGIPFAVNKDSYSFEYFASRKFNLCTPEDTERWFSEQYWEETKKFGEKLKVETSIEEVGLKLRKILSRF